MNKDCRKLGGKNFGELKSICIGNVIEIVTESLEIIRIHYLGPYSNAYNIVSNLKWFYSLVS